MAKIKSRGKFDKNFDSLIDKFEKRVYNSFKGDWRLKLLKEDLSKIYNSPKKLDIWDIGCGFGQISLWFAKNNHNLICCDISYKMLQKAKENFEKENIDAKFYQLSAQDMSKKIDLQDLVIFHAVIEWLAKPMETLEMVSNRVKVGGYISILFFNYNSLIYKNMLRGKWRLKMLLDNSWYGKGKKLTPPHPQKPEVLIKWLKTNHYKIIKHTGIRVFYDYMENDILQESNLNEIIELEYRYCREDTFKNMGRYIHILAQKES